MRVLVALLIGWIAVNVVIVLGSIFLSKLDAGARARQRAGDALAGKTPHSRR